MLRMTRRALHVCRWLFICTAVQACIFPDWAVPVPPIFPADAALEPEDAGDAEHLPDLRIHRGVAAQSLLLAYQAFDENSCELQEACVNGGGARRLLQFEGRVENVGRADLRAGRPSLENPNFEYSTCHEHFHLLDFTDYKLMHRDGSVAAQGHKQSFCLVSMEPVSEDITPAPPGTHPPPQEGNCDVLAAGWADVYGIGTPCQWVDVTDVAEGDYVLQLSVNPADRLRESATDNNIVRIPVHLSAAGDPVCQPQQEFCGDALDQDCDGFPDVWDVDCWGGCVAGDTSCQEVIGVSGNGQCERAHALVPQGTYEVALAPRDDGAADPRCGAGATAFFRLTLPARRAVYLGTLRSEIAVSLAVYRDGCGGELLRCEQSACGQERGQFVEILEPGAYLVAVTAREAEGVGRARLTYQTAAPAGARLLHAAGTHEGDTRAAGDSVEACDGPPAFANDDVYLLAACPGEISVSTCAARSGPRRIGVHSAALANPSLACSGASPADGARCGRARPHGASLRATVPEGLTFVVVEGEAPDRAGSYRLSVAF